MTFPATKRDQLFSCLIKDVSLALSSVSIRSNIHNQRIPVYAEFEHVSCERICLMSNTPLRCPGFTLFMLVGLFSSEKSFKCSIYSGVKLLVSQETNGIKHVWSWGRIPAILRYTFPNRTLNVCPKLRRWEKGSGERRQQLTNTSSVYFPGL